MLTPGYASSGMMQMSRYNCSKVPIYSMAFACKLITGLIILANVVNKNKAGCCPFCRFGTNTISVYLGICK